MSEQPAPAGLGDVDVATLDRWIRTFADRVHRDRDELTALDAAIGDADHGSNLDRGMSAVLAALDAAPPADAGALLKTVAMNLISKVGGASGPLYGTFFLRASAAVGSVGAVGAPELAKAVRAGLEGVIARGKAALGEKTMVDALTPACDALDAALEDGAGLAEAVAAASGAADTGRDATTPMIARKGRASYLGERSVGHQDPGATSTALLVGALADVVTGAGAA